MIRCRSPHRHCQRLSCRVAADLSPAVLESRRCAKRPGPKVCAEEARVEQPLQSSNSYRAVIGHRDSWLALSFRAKQWRVRKTQAAGYRAGKSRCTGQDYNKQSLAHKSSTFLGSLERVLGRAECGNWLSEGPQPRSSMRISTPSRTALSSCKILQHSLNKAPDRPLGASSSAGAPITTDRDSGEQNPQ